MSRHSWRGIFIIIVIVSIPCYLLGFWFLASSPDDVEPTLKPSPDLTFLTELAVPTETQVEPSPTTFIIVTLDAGGGITRIAPTTIPILTTAPTNTLIPTAIQPTAIPPTTSPTATQPILLPPTDTPSAGG